MTPQKQTIVSDPHTGAHGNCLSACLASLLDIPVENTPTFYGKDWGVELIKFLDENGCDFNGCASFAEIEKETGIDGFVIVGGGSPRGLSCGHAVIYKNGEPYFDPHPSNDFLTKPEMVYSITRKLI